MSLSPKLCQSQLCVVPVAILSELSLFPLHFNWCASLITPDWHSEMGATLLRWDRVEMTNLYCPFAHHDIRLAF